jgi:ABC-type branched-subunit amino acid transport system ATPase component
VLEINNLREHFGAMEAVRGIGLEMAEAQCLAS